MSVTPYTDPSLEVRPASAFIGFWAALANVTVLRETALDEAEIALAEGEANINRGVEAMARLIVNSRIAAGRGELIHWDYLIERLEFYETEAARDLAQIKKLVDRILTSIRAAAPVDARRARALAQRQKDAVARFVEALREARWQAMASRAHFDPASRSGPVFENSVELRRYLANA
jgi:hypothetical protein